MNGADDNLCAQIRILSIAYVEGDDLALAAARDACLEAGADLLAEDLDWFFATKRETINAKSPGDRAEWLRIARESALIGYEEWCRLTS